jgi:hypothetical protein
VRTNSIPRGTTDHDRLTRPHLLLPLLSVPERYPRSSDLPVRFSLPGLRYVPGSALLGRHDLRVHVRRDSKPPPES